MNDFAISLIRTGVPAAVGTAVAWLVGVGVNVDPDTQTALAAALVTVCITAYYALARAAESKWPRLGWLLGVAKQPSYGDDLGVDDLDEVGVSDAPEEWLAAAGTAPGDALPEADLIDDGTRP